MEENKGEIFLQKKAMGLKKRDSLDPGVSGGLFLKEKQGEGKQGRDFFKEKIEGAKENFVDQRIINFGYTYISHR